ncbi:winged helix-turn-helix transcriptional regulator [Roseovarius phycicola]|uniref:Helix-turn-helix domain-containing protein n=1 Tax=Roseovarius phycicola TaxID=3080976 RepID=A0ABZ2HGR1_9RHOB
MAKSKSYNLLCPIARALDALGDRWSLLILRDLHAGPARFADLQKGLAGIASNLLTDRLAHLSKEGLIEKTQGAHNTALYQLTNAGWATRGLLFDLALVGGRMQPVPEPKKPGNLRTVAVTLAAALDRVVAPDTSAQAQLTVDDEPFAISIHNGDVSVLSGPNPDRQVSITTTYPDLLAAAAGAMPLDAFAKSASITANDARVAETTMTLLGAAMAQMQ